MQSERQSTRPPVLSVWSPAVEDHTPTRITINTSADPSIEEGVKEWRKRDKNPRNRHSTSAAPVLSRRCFQLGECSVTKRGRSLADASVGGRRSQAIYQGGTRLVRVRGARVYAVQAQSGGFQATVLSCAPRRATLGRPWNVSSQLFSRGPISSHIPLRAASCCVAVVQRAERRA